MLSASDWVPDSLQVKNYSDFTISKIILQFEEENLENITKLASEYNISLVMFDWLKTAVVSNTVPRKFDLSHAGKVTK